MEGEVFWFEVNSFGFDIEGAGRDAGKVAFSPLTLTLDSNTALAPLLTMAATGGHVDSATLVGMRADGEPITYQMDLEVVFVTKVEDIAGAGLTVSLEFGADQASTVHPGHKLALSRRRKQSSAGI